jgi:prostaglandin-E synthase
MQPASAKRQGRRDCVFTEVCVEDSEAVNVNFEKSKLTFSCLGGSDNFKHLNETELFHCIDPNDSKLKRTDRSILCCLRKGESGQSWPRLTKERAKVSFSVSYFCVLLYIFNSSNIIKAHLFMFSWLNIKVHSVFSVTRKSVTS